MPVICPFQSVHRIALLLGEECCRMIPLCLADQWCLWIARYCRSIRPLNSMSSLSIHWHSPPSVAIKYKKSNQSHQNSYYDNFNNMKIFQMFLRCLRIHHPHLQLRKCQHLILHRLRKHLRLPRLRPNEGKLIMRKTWNDIHICHHWICDPSMHTISLERFKLIVHSLRFHRRNRLHPNHQERLIAEFPLTSLGFHRELHSQTVDRKN